MFAEFFFFSTVRFVYEFFFSKLALESRAQNAVLGVLPGSLLGLGPTPLFPAAQSVSDCAAMVFGAEFKWGVLSLSMCFSSFHLSSALKGIQAEVVQS